MVDLALLFSATVVDFALPFFGDSCRDGLLKWPGSLGFRGSAGTCSSGVQKYCFKGTTEANRNRLWIREDSVGFLAVKNWWLRSRGVPLPSKRFLGKPPGIASGLSG